MNTYLIEHKIRILTKLWNKKFTHDGFEFRHWAFTVRRGSIGKAWVVRKEIAAPNAIDAINQFRSALFPIIDRIAFLGQCYTMAEVESFFILRENGNHDNVFFFNYTREREGVPLAFKQEQMDALIKLDQYQEKGDVFRYLREVANASTLYTRFAMLSSAMEAMAGEKTGTKKKETNKEYIRDHILKDKKLYDNIFKYGEGIRNRLLHGAKVDFGGAKHKEINYIEKIYGAIVRYFNENHGTNISTAVVNPLRTPYGNYEQEKSWLKPKNKQYSFDLRVVTEHYTEQYDRNGAAHTTPPPDCFESVGRPPDY